MSFFLVRFCGHCGKYQRQTTEYQSLYYAYQHFKSIAQLNKPESAKSQQEEQDQN